MLTPFLKYVSEGKVIRRHSDLARYSFPEVTERIYLSFLALTLMRNTDQARSFTKMYADQTMAKGTFDQVTGLNTDDAKMFRLYNAAFKRLPDSDGLKY